jgi:tetratricopeptide (TPR) repeat protein
MRSILACALAAFVALQQFPPARPPVGTGGGGGTQGRGGATGQRPPPRPMNSRTRSATADAMDRYVPGDYEKAVTTLANLGGFDMMGAEEWIISGTPGAVQRRRLIAAIVALEYTASRPGLSPSLFEWGAKTLSASVEPQPSEALWLRASVALAEGRAAWPILMGLPPGLGARPVASTAPPDPLLGHGHLAYALSRFPDDPHFKLAQIVSAEATTSPATGAIVLTPDGKGVVTDQLDAQMLPRVAPGPARPTALLERAAEAAGTLTSNSIVGPEAHLRLGYLQLRLGHHDLALQQFRQIDTADSFVAYLGHLFSGWTLAKDGQADAAVAAYRAALGVVPHARSASTLLTTFCIMSGRQDEAEKLANELMTKPAVAEDPWRTYLLGDYREYPKLIARLREAIQ